MFNIVNPLPMYPGSMGNVALEELCDVGNMACLFLMMCVSCLSALDMSFGEGEKVVQDEIGSSVVFARSDEKDLTKENKQTPNISATTFDRCYGASGEDEINAACPTLDGGFVMAGNTCCTRHHSGAWLIRTDSLGKICE